jgi:ssDNA-binding Zn-finger/Zn-ribbon topoisomerase 1
LCNQPDCDFRTKETGTLKQHKANKHDMNVVWHLCNQPDCDFKAKHASDLRQHEANKHNIDITWRLCNQPGCNFKSKTMGHLNLHKADIHDIGVVVHCCDYPDCEYTAKRASSLIIHMKAMHWNTYCARKKEQEERVRTALLATGWLEYFASDTLPPLGYFKREKRIDFACVDAEDTWCRVDFVLGTATGYVFLEVDEHQHRFGYDAMLSCDMKRMAKVMASLALEAGASMPNVFWVRYNPNAWHVNGALQSVPKVERESWLCAFLSELTMTQPLTIGYAYYDSSDGALEVLQNAEYHPQFAGVAFDLRSAHES